MKKLRFVLCSLLAFLLIATSIPVVTEAAAKPVCQKATTLHYQYSVGTTVIMESLYIGNLSRSAKVTGIRSSNKNIKAQLGRLCYNAIWIDKKIPVVASRMESRRPSVLKLNRMEKPTSFHPGSLLKDLTRYSKVLRSEIKSMLLILQDTGELKHR